MPQPLNKEVLSQQTKGLFAQYAQLEGEVSPEEEALCQALFGSKPPKAIIFASSSLRKGILLNRALVANHDKRAWPEFASHISFDAESLRTPSALHRHIEGAIQNGDGIVRTPFFVGYFAGKIPIFQWPTDGESQSNEPLAEAWNKLLDVEAFTAGEDIIIFSSDAVQSLRTSQEKLGKPEKLPEFQGVTSEADIVAFKAWYLERFYTVTDGVPLIDRHLTGLVVKRGEAIFEEILELSIEIEEWLLEFVEVGLQMGGGGLTQQFVQKLAEADELIYLQLNDSLKEYLQEVDKEVWPFVVLYHIMGMCAWRLPHAFLQVSQAANEKESL